MKAITIHTFGGPEVLQLQELPTPEPAEGQVLVQVQASGVNFLDIYQRTGAYQLPLPATLGQEGAGTVKSVGAGVQDVKPGDRVGWSMVQGAYADHALVPAGRLVRLPEHLDANAAAAVMLQGFTAHYLTFSMVQLQPGDTVLVHAAAGGVGLLLCQMLKMRGVRVIGTVSTEEKAKLAEEAGADETILYTELDFEQETRRLTDGQGVAVVYDSVGRDTFDHSLNCLRRRGSLVLFGASSGAVPSIDPQILNPKGSLWLTRPTLAHYIADPAELRQRADDVFGWIAAGKLKVRIDRTYPLSEAATAHRALAARETAGKVLLIP
jgi:NADPH:quinone reductase